MSSNRARRQSSLTVDQKIGSRVSDRWYPMRQALFKKQTGGWVTEEVFVDMKSGQRGEPTVAHDEAGWSGSPPDLPSGDPGRAAAYQPASATYRANYAKIDWGR